MPWSEGLATWTNPDEGVAFISVAFTWKLGEVAEWARYYAALGYRVRAGGYGVFAVREKIKRGTHPLAGLVELGGEIPDAVAHQNPLATRASYGCPERCPFCMVPFYEGRVFTLNPEFPVRPILIDNNLSGLSVEYQRHIIDRYVGHGVRITDANSGFEPKSFDEDCYERWRGINDGPWRFGFDETHEMDECERVFRMLRKRRVPSKRIRPYVIIGNEPFELSMERILKSIEWGGEPHVQPYMKLNTEIREPWAQFDWTIQKLRDVARWANSRQWRQRAFAEYDRSARKSARADRYRASDGLFI